jgi:hypothetical protein
MIIIKELRTDVTSRSAVKWIVTTSSSITKAPPLIQR